LRYYLRMHAGSGMSEGLAIEQAELAVEVFRMLSDTTRVRLLWELIDQELAVNELAARVGKPAPSVSQHLAKLRMARLVRTRREGTQVFYRLENEHVARLVRDAVYNAEHAGPEVPRHHVRRRSHAAEVRAQVEIPQSGLTAAADVVAQSASPASPRRPPAPNTGG
jgi:DNA-binding transcriptional ArsR family regulator